MSCYQFKSGRVSDPHPVTCLAPPPPPPTRDLDPGGSHTPAGSLEFKEERIEKWKKEFVCVREIERERGEKVCLCLREREEKRV